MSGTDPMAEIRASFFIECGELLEAAQDGLQAMSDGDDDAETINAVFRAVHSIKGGAGAFGLDDLVQFAHQFETVLDEVRAGRFDADAGAINFFFGCCDLLADLVEVARDGGEVDAARLAAACDRLEGMVGEDAGEEVGAEEFQATGLTLDLGADLPPLDLPLPEAGPESVAEAGPPAGAAEPAPSAAARDFAIAFHPRAPLYALGNEPLFLFQALAELGELSVEARTDDVPTLDAFDPGAGYVGWNLRLTTEAGLEAVQEVFDFVEDLATLSIEESAAGAAPGVPPSADASIDLALPCDPPPVAEPPAAPAPAEMPAVEPENPVEAPGTTDPAAAAEAQPAAAKPASQAQATVRVDLDRIDRLVNLVGELVINQAMLSQSVAEAGLPPSSGIVNGLEEFQQLTRDIQDSVMMIRAQPVKSLFQRMSRIVREASSAVDKSVRLVTDGEATEIDKTVIERLADPLTHMIRNAVDHGLEPTEKRIAAGKPAEGVVRLRAAHKSGRVVIDISDDGGGINREKVFEIAVSKGLIPADSQLSDGEIDNLLFLPGFSTASSVSNLSGRGVGMDVVRSAIQSLGGRITIASERGRGTTFSISLPLTLAVLDGMIVNVAGETLVVPLGAIVETMTLTAEDVRPLGHETQVVHIRGQFAPLLDLGAELGYRPPLDSYIGCVVLLIAHEDGTRAALVVEAIQDQRQVVIKGLQDSYGRVPGVAAATILGDGQIALILDPVDITANACGRTMLQAAPAQSAAG